MQNPQELLNEEFNKRRTRNPNFSLRAFAKWLGVSPAQLSQMMTGKRTITLNTFKKISGRLGLSPLEKKTLINTLLTDKKFIEPPAQKNVLHMEEDQFRLISDWYHFAILSLTKLKKAQPDPRWISRKLGIRLEDAHQALLRLVRLGIVETKPFKQVSSPIEVTAHVPSEAIRKYHKQNLNLAIEKIETVPMKLREYQSISIPFNPKKIGTLKKLMDDFLEQAAQLAEKDNADEVYNLNVQFFPITTIKENKE